MKDNQLKQTPADRSIKRELRKYLSVSVDSAWERNAKRFEATLREMLENGDETHLLQRSAAGVHYPGIVRDAILAIFAQ